jgi:hypothetical protein
MTNGTHIPLFIKGCVANMAAGSPVEGTRALGPELAQLLKVLTAYTLRMTLYSYWA